MKNILLLGDSIRQNYQEYVRDKLQNIADVYYPNDNGRFCYFTLRYLHEWIRALSKDDEIGFDIIHFNCGLWDILRLSNENKTFTSEKDYAELLVRIIDRIHFLCPNSKVIFALTTEVIEPGFERGVMVAERRNEDIRKYNDIAQKICEEMQIQVDDLWSISRNLPQEAHSDLVHYETDIGIKALGNQVARCLMLVMEEMEKIE